MTKVKKVRAVYKANDIKLMPRKLNSNYLGDCIQIDDHYKGMVKRSKHQRLTDPRAKNYISLLNDYVNAEVKEKDLIFKKILKVEEELGIVLSKNLGEKYANI